MLELHDDVFQVTYFVIEVLNLLVFGLDAGLESALASDQFCVLARSAVELLHLVLA